MRKRNIFVRFVGYVARRFRVLQEVWILPWWGRGRLVSVPMWALDLGVLIIKLVSTCVVAAARLLIPSTLKSLYGETILITGAGHGVGRELALQFAALGATVICWDKDARRNRAVVDEIRKNDGDCYGFTVDITVRDQVTSVAAYMRRQLTDVSMVVSNAGALTRGSLTHLRPESVRGMIETNLLAHFWIIEAFLPSMMERRHGHIVAINSGCGLMPWPDMATYCAAKHGLRGLMESLSEELRMDTWAKNIHTTSVYLATVSTGLYPSPSHRFTWWYSDVSAKEAARIIITGIRKNRRCISIPYFMKTFIDINSLMPYRIRLILTDFFSYPHRSWFCFC